MPAATAALQLTPDGSVRLQPQETGQQALVMPVLAALYARLDIFLGSSGRAWLQLSKVLGKAAGNFDIPTG
jgi:hypothetical protein